MAEYILGIPLNSQQFQDEDDRFNSYRRNILHYYPNGQASLTGVLSLIGEESVSDNQFFWFEDRYELPKTTCRAGGSAALTTGEPASATALGTSPVTDGTGAVTVNTDYYLTVNGTQHIREGSLLSVGEVGTTALVQLQVMEITRNSTIEVDGYVRVRLIRAGTFSAAATTYNAADFLVGQTVQVVGHAAGEGASGAGFGPTPFKRPMKIENQTAISRTPWEMSGSVLQMGLKYDDTGPYNEEAKKKEIEHMTLLERKLLFGQKSTTVRPSLTAGRPDETVRTMSGIIEFLQLWDAGTSGLQIDGNTYAPYSTHAPVTSDTDDDKRIIENAGGTMSRKKWSQYAERVSRFHSPMTNERLVLCGSGALLVFDDMFNKDTEFHVKADESIFGLNFTTLVTPFGKFHFMIHPMFNMRADWRHWALILDVHSLKYRPLKNRDTALLKNRQSNGDDYRRDEFLTEMGLEFWQPEANMLIKNIVTYAAS